MCFLRQHIIFILVYIVTIVHIVVGAAAVAFILDALRIAVAVMLEMKIVELGTLGYYITQLTHDEQRPL